MMNEAVKGWVKLAEMYPEENPTNWQELKDKHGVELLRDGVKYSDGVKDDFSVYFCYDGFKEILNGEPIYFEVGNSCIGISTEDDTALIHCSDMTQSPKFDQETPHIIHNGVKYLVEDNDGEPVLVKAGHKSGDVVPLNDVKEGELFTLEFCKDKNGSASLLGQDDLIVSFRAEGLKVRIV